METVCALDKCNGCMACIDKCPKSCISIEDNMFAYNAVKDMNVCINCGQCERVCPNNNIVKKTDPIEWKQGWAEWKIRSKSSSGGAASAIIKSFIKSGGYVASCLFKDGQFIFDVTNDFELAKKFSGSKYVKSNPAGIYQKVQQRLKTDKILFVGLPCQVAGLKNFIKNRENLYTIDLICHGTPSPKVLECFLREENILLNDIKDIKFRKDTELGLNVDEKKVTLSKVTDNYLLTFLDCISYTNNCFECQFATWGRISDVTLGDSWGTELEDEFRNGVSLIILQSKKGHELVYGSNLNIFDVDIENARQHNHQLSHPSIVTRNRNNFLNDLCRGRSFDASTIRAVPWMYFKQKIKLVLFKLHLYR